MVNRGGGEVLVLFKRGEVPDCVPDPFGNLLGGPFWHATREERPQGRIPDQTEKYKSEWTSPSWESQPLATHRLPSLRKRVSERSVHLGGLVWMKEGCNHTNHYT